MFAPSHIYNVASSLSTAYEAMHLDDITPFSLLVHLRTARHLGLNLSRMNLPFTAFSRQDINHVTGAEEESKSKPNRFLDEKSKPGKDHPLQTGRKEML